MFKGYMTEKFSLKVLNIGVLMYGFFLKFYCIWPFCTGLPVLPTGMYWSPAFGYWYLLISTCMYLYVLVSYHMYSPPDLGTRMYLSPVVCTRLLTSRHSYVLVSSRMYSSPFVSALICSFRPDRCTPIKRTSVVTCLGK